MDINEDHLEARFASYCLLEEIARILNKADVPTGDLSVHYVPGKKDFRYSRGKEATLLVV